MTSTMIHLTEAAILHLRKKIADKKALGFRLGIKSSGCSGFRYVPELALNESPNDLIIEVAEGVTVFIPEDARSAIEGMTIDFVSKDLGLKQMVFNNPRAENLCGCGESFSIKETVDDD
ncbi:MAG: hypothetical protein CL816_02945 [Coxiellaceae bacterium]|nr:hypothetical protein [Coxiellaceae bacterium]|tara:strand:+ start:8483 stop:8839 length:357 start_codon:yes stop_codon:yes gene_type:complete